MKLPKCSIIIPLFNRSDLTRGCLETLVEHTTADLYEVVLVDNGSTDQTHELLDQLDGDVTIVRNKKNLGFATACNQGAEAASTDLLLFLNNDTQLLAGWLEPLLKTTQDFPEVGAVGAKLIYPNNTIQHAGVTIFYNRFQDLFGGFHRMIGLSSDVPPANNPEFIPAVTAAAMLVRSQAFRDVGGFDTDYWNGNEDVDLCLKLGEAGWKIYYQPLSTIIHLESQSGSERVSKTAINNKILADKWVHRVVPDLIYISGNDLAEFGSFPWLAESRRPVISETGDL